MEMEKAELWARRARLSAGKNTLLVEFARRFLYGTLVPTRSEVREAAFWTRSVYSDSMRSDSGVTVYVFALAPCHRAANLVAFKVGADDRVEVCKYRRGECPWFDYTAGGARSLKADLGMEDNNNG